MHFPGFPHEQLPCAGAVRAWGRGVLWAAGVGWLTGVATGVEAGPDLMELSVEQLAEVKVDMVYAPSRAREKLTEAPASVSIVTREEIRRFGYRTLGDIVKSVRGFDVMDDRNYSYTGVRGYSSLGDYGSHVLLLVDGHRVNDPIYDVVAVGTEGLLDVDLIERVELIRGPASMYYGSNTFSGAINVVTRKGESVGGVETAVRAGSYNTFQTRVTGGGVTEGGIDYLWSISHMASEGRKSLYYREYDQPENNGGEARNLDGDRFWSGLLKLSYNDFTFQGGYVTRDKDVPTGSFGSVFNRSSTSLDSRGYVELRYAKTTADQWDLTARAYYDSYEYDALALYEAEGGGSEVNNDSLTARWWGVEAGAAREFGPLRLSAGAEFRQGTDIRQLNYDEDPFAVLFSANSRYVVMGGYGDARLRLTETLSASAGLRVDHYDSFGFQLSPRMALNWKPAKETIVKLLYGEAFGGPNLAYLDYETAEHQANRHLQPETIQSLELAVERQLGRTWRVSGSLFHNQLKDLLETGSTEEGLSIYRNGWEAEVNGVELEWEGRFSNGSLLRFSAVRQEAENRTTGARLPNSPDSVVKAHLSVPVLDTKAYAGLEVLYSSGRQTLLGRETPDAWQVNFVLYRGELFKGVDVSAGIYNVLDQEYAFPGGKEHRQDMLRQNGRTFSVQATWHF